LYVIESGDAVELLDVQELVARPEKITIIANEYNPLDWHGWLEIGRFKDDRKTLSSKIYNVFTVRFRRNGTSYTGMARIISDPVATGKTVRLDLCGVDVLYIN
jgi:ribosomal protein RSM22 (predicted rRNA methylase)